MSVPPRPGRSNISFRMTPQRQVILEELSQLTCHPTADEVYVLVRKRLPRISLGTVYRNLDIMANEGLIRKIQVGGTQKRFDAHAGSHDHFRCEKCQTVRDLDNGMTSVLDEARRQLPGYLVTSYRLEILGLCPNCYTTTPGAATANSENTTADTTDNAPENESQSPS